MEDSHTPPDITVLDLRTGKLDPLTDLNPECKYYRLGKIEKLEVKNKYGTEEIAYLLYPVNYQPGQKYPLIVATYGFSGGFITDAEWHSSFPAQTLAGEGYVVLLLNVTSSTGQEVANDPERARWAEGWNMLATVDAAVQLINSMGLSDGRRIGLYGWSHGAFVVQFVAAHSNLFQAFAMGEGGDWNPGGFWLSGSRVVTQIYHNLFGGAPHGQMLKAYEDFSPSMNVNNIHAPMLFEFAGQSPVGMELYVYMRDAKLPAELVFYDQEEHIFVKPRARLAAMARKVDWFNYWLLDEKDPNPAKQEQYRRWDEMKQEWEAKQVADQR
jgi:dipeptidyl aminopeptidase/acylaminoacyl peptidase